MDRADVGVLEGGLENFVGRKRIQVQDGQRFAVAIAAAQGHVGDIDLVVA
jgi:hypothetical protein